MEICASCYPVRLPANDAVIRVKSGITNFEDCFWTITDKFGKVYSGECTPHPYFTDQFTIDPNDTDVFPVGLFREFSGAFVLKVVDAYNQAEDFSFNTVDYGCVSIEFYNYTGEEIESVIL